MKPKKLVFITSFRDQGQTLLQSSHGQDLTELEWCLAEQEHRRKVGESTSVILDNKGRCALVKLTEVG